MTTKTNQQKRVERVLGLRSSNATVPRAPKTARRQGSRSSAKRAAIGRD